MTDPKTKRCLYQGTHLHMYWENGWEYVHRPNAGGIVAIVAVTDDGKLILVEQYRRPVDKRVIELPAGLAGDTPDFHGESLDTAAKRELLEETGYACDAMTYIAQGPASAGLSTEVISIYYASGLEKKTAGGGDESEDIIVHEVPLDEADAWLARRDAEGCFVDVKVYAGLYFAGRRL